MTTGKMPKALAGKTKLPKIKLPKMPKMPKKGPKMPGCRCSKTGKMKGMK
jgi:hypothetical protein